MRGLTALRQRAVLVATTHLARAAGKRRRRVRGRRDLLAAFGRWGASSALGWRERARAMNHELELRVELREQVQDAADWRAVDTRIREGLRAELQTAAHEVMARGHELRRLQLQDTVHWLPASPGPPEEEDVEARYASALQAQAAGAAEDERAARLPPTSPAWVDELDTVCDVGTGAGTFTCMPAVCAVFVRLP